MINARQELLDLNESMVKLHARSEFLRDAQMLQEMTQARIHQQMEAGFDSALGRLVEVEMTARALHSSIQDASNSIAQITSLTKLIRNFWSWISLITLVWVFIFGADRLNASSRKIASAFIGQYAASHLRTSPNKILSHIIALQIFGPFFLLLHSARTIGILSPTHCPTGILLHNTSLRYLDPPPQSNGAQQSQQQQE